MTIEIRNIIPPDLSDKNIGQKIICHRSMRIGSPKLNIEKISNKIIANNYGHGGSGWTIGPGCVNYVNNLLIESRDSTKLKTTTPIVILGAGIIGLYTAYDLIKKGYRNITIIASQFKYLVSHNAGGLLAPVSMDNSKDHQILINQLGVESYNFFKSIADKNHKDFKIGAKIISTYFRTKDESGLEPYVGVVMKPAKDVILDFGNGTKQKMIAYDDGIFIDTSLLMQALENYLQNKVIFKKQKINNFSEIKSSFIINCSGIGASKLNNDKKLISVQGHIIMLKKQKKQNLNYMIFTHLEKTINNNKQNIKRAFYFAPKKLPNTQASDLGVIGGSFIENAYYKTPNLKEFDNIINNARKFYGIDKK